MTKQAVFGNRYTVFYSNRCTRRIELKHHGHAFLHRLQAAGDTMLGT